MRHNVVSRWHLIRPVALRLAPSHACDRVSFPANCILHYSSAHCIMIGTRRGTMEEVTASQAATLTGLSERTIRRKIASGEIPARHVAPNRYAINVAHLPVRQPSDVLLTRIEELEHRVRLLELRLRPQRLAGANLASAPAEHGDSAVSETPALGELLM